MLLFPAPFRFRLAIGPRNLPPSSSRLNRGYNRALSWRSKVKQITEPTIRILDRPTMQLDLHPSYRRPCRIKIRPTSGAGIHRRVFDHCSLSLTQHAAALPHVHGLSPARSTTTAPPHPRPSTGDGSIHRCHPGRSAPNGTARRWFPRSLLFDQRVRHPALPLQHRHGYAVDLHHDLPTQTCATQPGVPHHH
jgi:hypothetical protein